ncbi:hypothetical protein [Nocardia sp. NPDC051570]|uniref:hypothetical protein n=1 Tax=Nocardia sp. NPDC051570 TaxID=3364324 RepID=UPI003790FFD1
MRDTSAFNEPDRRITRLEGRVTDLEEGYGASILGLRRDAKGLRLGQDRLFGGLNSLGGGIALMMERLGLHPIGLPVAAPPTEDEVDDAFEADNS